jgi:hypothetical protein
VVLADVNEAQGAAVAKGLGGNALFVQINVSKWEDNVWLFKRTWEWSDDLIS